VQNEYGYGMHVERNTTRKSVASKRRRVRVGSSGEPLTLYQYAYRDRYCMYKYQLAAWTDARRTIAFPL
jgi:hypothetical protein